MKPKSPLPWKRQLLPDGQYEFQDANNEQVFEDGTFPDSDTRYALHACNAYPKLVAALKLAVSLGEDGYPFNDVDELLKELGE